MNDRPSPLVDVSTLIAALDGPHPPLLLDVRWRLGSPPLRDAYLAGHLPGAVWVDLDADLAAAPGAGGRHPLPAPDVAQTTLRRLGVSDQRPVVAYDDTDGSVAARAWWLLRWLGHPDVRLLDGGLRAWTAAGQPVEPGDVTVAPGDITARPGSLPVLDADAAARLARDGVLLDARAGERYRGEVEPVDPVAGHVPGARSAPSTGNVGPDGRFLDPAALRARFAALGVTGGAQVGAYCGSGVTAAHTVLALEVAGVDAALYAGSWSEWVTDPSRPVATGDD
jgi:thiosulfate/3-mercaptopyruvate sulfurtransferase